MKPNTRLIIVSLGLLTAVIAVLAVAATAGNPQLLFTDNTAASSTSTEITEMEQALLDRINAAATSIDAAIYGFDRISIRDALIAAHNRGVTVRVATDDDAYNDTDYNPHFTALETAGIPIVLDNRSSIMHNKFFIIDGQVVWTGSTNLTDTGFTLNHNNSTVFTSTLLADIYEIEFEEMYVDKLFGTAKSDNVTHTLSYDGNPLEVYFSPSDGALDQVIDEVNAAGESIHFSIFFSTDDGLRDALIAKAQEGLTISGVWDALGAGNQYSDDEALCDAGIVIKRENFPGKMHNKFMVIDASGTSPVVITGSMNWSASGDDANDENTLIFHDGEAAQAYLAAFQQLYDALPSETACILEDTFIYLPIIMKPMPPTATPTITPTPTSTSVPTSTPTPTPTPTSTPTATPPPQASGNVKITKIFYDGAGSSEPDEYVEIRNDDTASIQLSGWTLRDAANHVFTFPSFLMTPGQVCRVYTNESHPEWCGFNYGSGSAIWNNGGDMATLRDGNGQTADTCSYGGGGSTAICD